jgi:hypothetical protein
VRHIGGVSPAAAPVEKKVAPADWIAGAFVRATGIIRVPGFPMPDVPIRIDRLTQVIKALRWRRCSEENDEPFLSVLERYFHSFLHAGSINAPESNCQWG